MRNRYLPPDALKVEPEATPADAPATVDRSAKLAARMQHRIPGGKGGMTPEDRIAHANSHRVQDGDRSGGRRARIKENLRNFDPTLDGRPPEHAERREMQKGHRKIKQIEIDRKRGKAASTKRQGPWADTVEIGSENDGNDITPRR